MRVRSLPSLDGDIILEGLKALPVKHGPLVIHLPGLSLPLIFVNGVAEYLEEIILKRLLQEHCDRLYVKVGQSKNETITVTATLNSSHLSRYIPSIHSEDSFQSPTSIEASIESSILLDCNSNETNTVVASSDDGLWVPHMSGPMSPQLVEAFCSMCSSNWLWSIWERWARQIAVTVTSTRNFRSRTDAIGLCTKSCGRQNSM